MKISDIKNQIDSLWFETENYWQDDISKKYKNTFIYDIDSILDNMNQNSNRMHLSCEEVLRKLDEIQEK